MDDDQIYQANRAMSRLLALETPEDAKKIMDSLEPGWEQDWAAAFGKAARKVFGDNSQA